MTGKNLAYSPPKGYNNQIWYMYALGYKEAALQLVNNIELSEKYISENIIFPVFFLYRHFIELFFKLIISEYYSFKGTNIKVPKTHNLKVLWDKVKPITNEISIIGISNRASLIKISITKESIIKIENAIIELNEYDKYSTSFRFPIDQFGNVSLQ